MKCLVVLAHPLENSLCRHLADETVANLKHIGHEVLVKDLYAEQFAPVLNKDERQSYYEDDFDASLVEEDIEQLCNAEMLVLVFPTWWFGLPAILKGWFDRVWAPGYAYNHAANGKAIEPLLGNLKYFNVVTTLGSPWWVDYFIMWKPVSRILKFATMKSCAIHCKFNMLSLYDCENVSEERVGKFVAKIKLQIN